MNQVTVDESLQSKLHNLSLHLELCDASGRVVAHLTPVLDPTEHVLEPQISREEMRRRKQSRGKTHTTAEVLASLKEG